MNRLRILIISVYCILCACRNIHRADLIVHNAHIYTVNDTFDKADAMALKDGKIVAIGPEHEILNEYSSTLTIDLEKKWVYPSFFSSFISLESFSIPIDSTLEDSKIDDERLAKYLYRVQDELFRNGVTHAGVILNSQEEIELIHQLYQNEKLFVKLNGYLLPTKELKNIYLKRGPNKKNKLDIRSFLFSSKEKPYAISPSSYGHKQVEEDIQAIYNTGFQSSCFYYGTPFDSAVLFQYKKNLKEVNDRRWRVTFVENTESMDAKVLKNFTIIPGISIDKNDSLRNAITSKLVSQNGMIVLNNTPRNTHSPIEQLYKVVSSVTDVNSNSRITRAESLRAITIWPSIANFKETQTGSLEVGKFGDFVILDRDLVNCKLEDISETNILQTFIEGNSVFSIKNTSFKKN